MPAIKIQVDSHLAAANLFTLRRLEETNTHMLREIASESGAAL